jgi:hypothetical protein
MRSPWSVGLLMILFSGIAVSNLGQPHAPLGPLQWAVVGMMFVAGALMFLNRPFTRWVALAAAALLAADGLVGLKRPEWGLPVPGYLSIVIGLYLFLRTLLTRTRPPAAPSGEA